MNPLVRFCDTFVVDHLAEHAKAGSITPLAIMAHSVFMEMRHSRIHRCVARTIAMLILDFMKFVVVSEKELS